MIRPCILALTLIVAAPVGAQMTSVDAKLRAATHYLETLYAFDFEALAELVTDDVAFSDPTATVLAGAELSYNGREQLISSFAASADGTRNASFEIVSSFTSSDYVVLTLTYATEVSGAVVGSERDWIAVRVPAVTILRLRDGLIAEHLDHVDYDALIAQVSDPQ